MTVYSMTRRYTLTLKEDKILTIAMCDLWMDVVIDPKEDVIDVMKKYGLSADDLEKLMLKLGVSDKTLWRHNEDLA
jgi:hypothetical protein